MGEELVVLPEIDLATQRTQTWMAAARGGRLENMRNFLAEGFAVDTRDHQGHTALMAASRNGHPEVVRELLQARADVNAVEPEYQTTALQHAVRGRHEEVVRALLDDERADADHAGDRAEPALVYAARNNLHELIAPLVAGGANVNQANREGGVPLLHDAIAEDRDDVAMQLILSGAALDQTTADGRSVLTTLVHGRKWQVLDVALNALADLDEGAAPLP